MTEERLVRRLFLRRSLQCLAGTLVLPFSAGCGKWGNGGGTVAAACDDIADLSTSEHSFRQSLGYIDSSPHGEERNCSNCYFFVRSDGDGCGRCNTVKGPIDPGGYCVAWTGHAT